MKLPATSMNTGLVFSGTFASELYGIETYSGLRQRRGGFVVKQAYDLFTSLNQASRFSAA